MDVNKNLEKREDFSLNEYNVPLCDYDNNGQVKKVRRRVLKKLMSYEYKAIFVWLIPTLIALACISVLSVVLSHFNLGFDSKDFSIIYFLTVYFLVIGNFMAIVLPLAVGSKRYRTNFFSLEGYLTMSIPASCDEHLLGKHIPMFLTTLLSIVACIVIDILTISFTKGSGLLFDGILGSGAGGAPFTIDSLFIILSVIFGFINFLLGIILVTVGQGVINGLVRRFSKQKSSLIVVAIFFGLTYGLTFLSIFLNTIVGFTEFLFTPAGIFVKTILTTIIFSLLIVWFYKIERDNLSVKLNLF